MLFLFLLDQASPVNNPFALDPQSICVGRVALPTAAQRRTRITAPTGGGVGLASVPAGRPELRVHLHLLCIKDVQSLHVMALRKEK